MKKLMRIPILNLLIKKTMNSVKGLFSIKAPGNYKNNLCEIEDIKSIYIEGKNGKFLIIFNQFLIKMNFIYFINLQQIIQTLNWISIITKKEISINSKIILDNDYSKFFLYKKNCHYFYNKNYYINALKSDNDKNLIM